MPILNDTILLPLSSIQFDRETRQRRKISTEGLKDSIAQHGLINPIIVNRDFILIAGERRYTACLELGWTEIPARFLDQLSEVEAQIIELEENLKRENLSWIEEAQAVKRLHEILCSTNEGWTQGKTAKKLNISSATISNQLKVSDWLDDPKVREAQNISAAINYIQRKEDRKTAAALEEIVHTTRGLTSGIKVKENKEEIPVPSPSLKSPPPISRFSGQGSSHNIVQADFTVFINSYSDIPFNFIHCDFPYGIGVFDGEFAGGGSHETYSDTPEIFWNLTKTLLRNLDKIMAPSAHLMFWFSMENYTRLILTFKEYAPDLIVSPFPLIWHKSDNAGIIPDAKRGPRRVYETALIASRGDRHVVAPISNTYACPTDRTIHPSTKPVPMLKHFFRLFVDNHTRLFDPTCGSGSSIRAAEDMNASYSFGLEKDRGFYIAAKQALEGARVLKRGEYHAKNGA